MSSSSSNIPDIGPPPSYAAPPIPEASKMAEPSAEEMDRYKGLLKKKPLKLGGRLAELQSADGYHRTKSNSTSTLYVNSTVSTPDVNELLRCVSIKIHSLVALGQEVDRKKYRDIFDERVHPIAPDFNDAVCPGEMDVYRFVEKIFTAERLSHECAIMMLCYIERIIDAITMDSTNWRRVVLSTLILASKVWEDQAVWNVDFLNVFPDLSVRDLGQLEKVLLQLLQYNVSLKSSLYTKYYFELRSLAEKDARNFPLEPLDKQNAKRLEQRSKVEEDRVKASYDASFVRSKSMTSIEPRAVKSPPVVLN